MTLKKVIQKLESQGYTIKAKKRSDGSYRITEIVGHGVHHAGKGIDSRLNAEARKLAGEKLSHRLIEQRREAGESAKESAKLERTGKAVKGKLSDEERKEIREAQKVLRKQGIKGKIKTSTFRKYAKEHGRAKAMESLRKEFIHFSKKAYPEQVKALMDYARDNDIIVNNAYALNDWLIKIEPFSIYDTSSVSVKNLDKERLLDDHIVKESYDIIYDYLKHLEGVVNDKDALMNLVSRTLNQLITLLNTNTK